jgi:carbonic anhydrase/acetyltransferase-like protein (isoleucine patch superfamily)
LVIRREPDNARLWQDALRGGFFVAIVSSVVATFVFLPTLQPLWLDRVGHVLAAVTAELVTVGLLRVVVPRPRAGNHLIGKNWDYVRWLSSAALAEVALHPVLRGPFWLFHFTRFLYLRALGADVSFRVGIPVDLTVRDPSLFAIAGGAQVEQGVVIENAVHATGRVRVDRVTIGGGCLVGAHTVLMPGTSLGHDARVSPGAYLGPDARVGVGAKIGERAVLAAGVEVGTHAVIEPGAVLSENVRVGDGARVSAGAVVPPSTEIPEREIWAGVPAGLLPRETNWIAEPARPGEAAIPTEPVSPATKLRGA